MFGPIASVLVIEDDEGLREMTCRRLQRRGYRVDAATDGRDAARKMDGRTFDAFVVDMIMPERDGVETILDIRRRSRSAYVVAVSGGGRMGARDILNLASHCGADDTLAKPYCLATLAEMISNHMGAVAS